MTKWTRVPETTTFANGETETLYSYVAIIAGNRCEINKGWSRSQGIGWEFYCPGKKVPVWAKTLRDAKLAAEKAARTEC